VNAIVVGAGPAGLAISACLKERGAQVQILERAPNVGSAWRGHYERLHLHTDKGNSALPGFPFPRDYPRYPARLQVVEYLENYAKHFGLAPSFDEPVTRVEPQGAQWSVTTAKRTLTSEHLVIATGYTRVPLVPAWPGQEAFKGEVLHSSRFQNGEKWRGKRVLVVGFGNSGGEIAIDLHEHGAQPTLAVRSAVNVIPRELMGLPILAVAALMRMFPPRVADAMSAPLLNLTIGDITKLGLRKQPYGPMEQIHRDGRIPLIDVGTVALLRSGGIKLARGLERFTAEGVTFEGGETKPFDAVVLATGYKPALEDFVPFAAELCDAHGFPKHSGTVKPGLHLCGFELSTRGMLKEIAIEARHLATAIA
jgi:cation diffusion facilitator CzcD-associated flavoprotein CzcO